MLALGPASVGVVVSTGIYASSVAWAWASWIMVSLAGVVAVAVIGGILTGTPMARIAPEIERASGALPEQLRRETRALALTMSMTTRVAIIVGVLFLMVRKHELLDSLLAILGPTRAA